MTSSSEKQPGLTAASGDLPNTDSVSGDQTKESFPFSSSRTAKDYALVSLKGMAMGAADVVPGVSGGTVAFITGIYDELINSLKQCGPEALIVLFKQGLPAAWRFVNGWFLLCLFIGIALSIKTFAAVISYCLVEYPLLVWGFFSGLILASVVQLVRHQPRWHWCLLLPCLCGTALVVGLAIIKPPTLPGTPLFLFLGGFVAICAMILPGVSGSFILLLVGLYPVFLQSVNELNFVNLGAFCAGAALGLMCFSRFLAWLLNRYHETTLATLIGFLIGSLWVTWPWKIPTRTVIDHHGEVVVLASDNVLPNTYAASLGNTGHLLEVLIFGILGLFLVLFSEYVARKIQRNN